LCPRLEAATDYGMGRNRFGMCQSYKHRRVCLPINLSAPRGFTVSLEMGRA
jgi:hypothetical protein